MKKVKIISVFSVILILAGVFFYLYYFYFNIERTNKLRRSIDKYTGQNLTVTIFSYGGQLLKQWKGVKKITSSGDARDYTFFYTKEGKYVQIPNSVTYIAEEE
jgi:hypothetical protein